MADTLQEFLSLVPVENFDRDYSRDITSERYFGFPIEPILRAEKRLRASAERSIGYLSMEYGLSSNSYQPLESLKPDNPKNLSPDHHVFSNLRAIDYYLSLRLRYRLDLPIYSGGLGVLAGDTLKSSADRNVSLAAVGILWNKGYFKQNFWFKDGQVPEENDWDPKSYPGLVPLDLCIDVPLKKENLKLRLWKYFVYSHDQSHVVPLILLDSNLPSNSEFARKLTGQLYRSDNAEWKLLQRLILGLGGMKALERLGYSLDRYHLNEGHAALAFVAKAKGLDDDQIEALKSHFAYTCHTPVAAGHDRFQRRVVQDILPDEEFALAKRFGQDTDYPDIINFTHLAMSVSNYVNAVAQKHGEVTRLQFPRFKDKIQAITNGVHTHTWVSSSFAALFDKYPPLAEWRQKPQSLSNVVQLKNHVPFRNDLWEAHQINKKHVGSLLKHWRLHHDTLTICWARRIAAYKRPSLVLQDVHRLLEIAKRHGPIQIIFAGKAHPADDLGFTYVNQMLSVIDSLEVDRELVRVLMLENYDTYCGKLLTSGVDVWLNNPLPPFEASGTSGMKAILNGVLQLSTLDGWVVEAADKDIGWIFGWEHQGTEVGDERNLRLMEDASLLYDTLEKIVPLFYHTVDEGRFRQESPWIDKMIHAIASAAFFSTDRMVSEYERKIWRA